MQTEAWVLLRLPSGYARIDENKYWFYCVAMQIGQKHRFYCACHRDKPGQTTKTLVWLRLLSGCQNTKNIGFIAFAIRITKEHCFYCVCYPDNKKTLTLLRLPSLVLLRLQSGWENKSFGFITFAIRIIYPDKRDRRRPRSKSEDQG